MKWVQILCLILALAAAVPLCNACTPASWAVAKASDPPLNLSATAFTQDHQVLEALQGWGSWTGRFQDPTRTTWACVDSRSSTTHHKAYATLETAGGDMSEVTALIIAYHRIKQIQPTEETVRAILHAFINQIATPARPFYYHTADDKLQHALAEFTNLTGRVVVSLPNREPADTRERDAWYEALTSVDSQGCGHIRQILLHPTDYDLRTPAEVSTPQWAIKAFYRYWWPTRDGSAQRRKVYLPVLQGTLAARALAIVNNEGPGCPGLEPDLAPFHGGSSMFLYHGNGVAAFRSRVLVPFITRLDPSVDGAALLTELTSLQDTHLAATIRLLAPLNTLPIWTADLTTSYVKK